MQVLQPVLVRSAGFQREAKRLEVGLGGSRSFTATGM